MALSFKPGVRVSGIRPEMVLAIQVVADACAEIGTDCVVTSVVDGKHSATSLHYAGCAVDVRTRDLLSRERLEARVRARLPPEDFDVVLEPTHLHVEFQPRQITSAAVA